MLQKKKAIERTNIPDAFKRNWPEIVESDTHNGLSLLRPVKNYEMKKLHIAYAPQDGKLPAMLIVSHPNRLPLWDELVWIRYQLCPEVEWMVLILPPLSKYINYTSGRERYTMTMEQRFTSEGEDSHE